MSARLGQWWSGLREETRCKKQIEGKILIDFGEFLNVGIKGEGEIQHGPWAFACAARQMVVPHTVSKNVNRTRFEREDHSVNISRGSLLWYALCWIWGIHIPRKEDSVTISVLTGPLQFGRRDTILTGQLSACVYVIRRAVALTAGQLQRQEQLATVPGLTIQQRQSLESQPFRLTMPLLICHIQVKIPTSVLGCCSQMARLESGCSRQFGEKRQWFEKVIFISDTFYRWCNFW